MPNHAKRLRDIRTFPSLIKFLRVELDWPIAPDNFEEMTFDYTPEELGIDIKNAVEIEEIKRLRPLSVNQPWGVFFVNFEPKNLPIVALRRILSSVALKKRASVNDPDRVKWSAEDLLFVSNYGEGEERYISLAHFAYDEQKKGLPTLKVLGWDNLDTSLHLDHVATELSEHLSWPDDEDDNESWRNKWRSAFTMQHRQVISSSKNLARSLAELARAIRDRILTALIIETETGPLTNLMNAFQKSLVHDLDASGFADMYAQTISYGLLSMRIADPAANNADDFAGHMRTNPFLKELIETFLQVEGRQGKASGASIDFDELGISEVVELLDKTNMKAVVRDFGDRKPEEDPVIHFYEDFLEEYDQNLKISRGVFYTPRPVVSYIVRSVDELLRSEFDLTDGLADTTTWGEMIELNADLKLPTYEIFNPNKPEPNVIPVSKELPFVQILDPATGTGTFLVEIIDVIHNTMVHKWEALGHDSEIIEELWNEYVTKNLLPRLHGYELMMAPYAIAHLKVGLKLYETGYSFGSDERARIYLTNALEPAHNFVETFGFEVPALAHEAQVVNKIKRLQPFTVVIGNPPYSKVSATMSEWIIALLKTNYPGAMSCQSYYEVDGAPLKERKVWLQDDYVKFIRLGQFSIQTSTCGILGFITNNGFLGNPTFNGMRQSLLSSFSNISIVNLHGDSNVGETPPNDASNENVFEIKQGVSISIAHHAPSRPEKSVSYNDLWGTRDEKYSNLMPEGIRTPPQILNPDSPLYLLLPSDEDNRSEFESGLLLSEVMPYSTSGVVTSKDHLVLGSADYEIEERMDIFLDKDRSDEEVMQDLNLSENYAWKVGNARERLTSDLKWRERFISILYRPYDVRRILYHPAVVWRTREKKMSVMLSGNNIGLLATRQSTTRFSHVSCSNLPIEMKACSHDRNTEIFPLSLVDKAQDMNGNYELWDTTNIAPLFIRALEDAIGMERGRCRKEMNPTDIFCYIFSLLHSPQYRARYSDQLKRSYPRIFLPNSRQLFDSLLKLGSELVELAIMDSPKLKYHITSLAGVQDFQVEKISYSDGAVWLDENKSHGFLGVPEAVWDFHIGGYQVCHKWLKSRKGRTLTNDDIIHYQKIIVAINETIRIMAEIDEVIEEHGGWPNVFATQ